MIVFALAGLLLTAEPTVAASAKPESPTRNAALLALPAGDEDIRRGLFEAHARSPERRVCTMQVLTGSRQPRRTCGTLAEWFAQRTPAEVQAQEAPWQLVEEIKKQRRKANMRSGAPG